jgi:hypothetical protein
VVHNYGQKITTLTIPNCYGANFESINDIKFYKSISSFETIRYDSCTITTNEKDKFLITVTINNPSDEI